MVNELRICPIRLRATGETSYICGSDLPTNLCRLLNTIYRQQQHSEDPGEKQWNGRKVIQSLWQLCSEAGLRLELRCCCPPRNLIITDGVHYQEFRCTVPCRLFPGVYYNLLEKYKTPVCRTSIVQCIVTIYCILKSDLYYGSTEF